MRGVACLLVLLVLCLPGCGQNRGPRGANRNEDRPRITPPEQPAKPPKK